MSETDTSEAELRAQAARDWTNPKHIATSILKAILRDWDVKHKPRSPLELMRVQILKEELLRRSIHDATGRR